MNSSNLHTNPWTRDSYYLLLSNTRGERGYLIGTWPLALINGRAALTPFVCSRYSDQSTPVMSQLWIHMLKSLQWPPFSRPPLSTCTCCFISPELLPRSSPSSLPHLLCLHSKVTRSVRPSRIIWVKTAIPPQFPPRLIFLHDAYLHTQYAVKLTDCTIILPPST